LKILEQQLKEAIKLNLEKTNPLSLGKRLLQKQEARDKLLTYKNQFQKLLCSIEIMLTKIRVNKVIIIPWDISNYILQLSAIPEFQNSVNEIKRSLLQNGLLTECNDAILYRSEDPNREISEDEIKKFVESYQMKIDSSQQQQEILGSLDELESKLNSLL